MENLSRSIAGRADPAKRVKSTARVYRVLGADFWQQPNGHQNGCRARQPGWAGDFRRLCDPGAYAVSGAMPCAGGSVPSRAAPSCRSPVTFAKYNRREKRPTAQQKAALLAQLASIRQRRRQTTAQPLTAPHAA